MWKPFLVVEMDDVPDMETREEIQQFFINLPKTHPHYVGRRIDFMEYDEGQSPPTDTPGSN